MALDQVLCRNLRQHRASSDLSQQEIHADSKRHVHLPTVGVPANSQTMAARYGAAVSFPSVDASSAANSAEGVACMPRLSTIRFAERAAAAQSHSSTPARRRCLFCSGSSCSHSFR